MYVSGVDTPDQVRERMKSFSIDVETYERGGSLEISSYDPWYMRKGVPNPTHEVLENLMKALERATASGKRGMRAASDASFQFIRRGKTKELLEYEASLDKELEGPVAAICAYDSKQVTKVWKGKFLFELIRTHGHAVFPGIALSLLPPKKSP